ncbi:MAG: gliding motility-associated C-terminal domain-containing protein [Lewinellaceae bacterium]|nr:gliding motility-associated C-terminal domain-containing protein [Lewinellaceae bacterium]
MQTATASQTCKQPAIARLAGMLLTDNRFYSPPRMMNKPLLWAILFFSTPAIGQTFIMNGAPIAACSGTFFDSGGSAGNYNNNQNLNSTICPDGTGGSHIRLQFDSTVLATGDQLCFHNGPDVLAPVLACASDFPAGQGFTIQAGANNPSGCLTVSFISNATGTAAGWSAAISCAAPCVVPAPANVSLSGMAGGNMTWTWDAVPGSAGYEVSVNGGAWMPANGTLSHTVSGLAPGNLVVLEIRPIPANPGCTVESITVNKTYIACTLNASLETTAGAICPGTATGSATITTTGAMGAVQFFVDANPAPFPSGVFNNFFAAGAHQVIVQDTAGCRDTVMFNITEPLPIAISITVTDAECFGDNSGIIQATASGGTGPYTYVWRNCQGGPAMSGATAFDLFAGCYAVTVTDSRGCTAIAQDTIDEPEMFHFSTQQDSVRCFGGMDGRGTVFVTGAMPPYTFVWSNGDTTQTADSLKAGFHSVTITDAVGCQAVTLVQILQPTALLIDSISLSPISCFGANDGSAQVFARGGVKPYAYLWNTMQTGAQLTNLGPGTYTVTLTDLKGCTVVSSAQLSAPPALTVQLVSVQAESCAGACDGQMTLNAAGGTPPLSITWSSPMIPPGTTMPQNLCPGNYQVTVSDSKGCTQSQTAAVAAAAPLEIQFTATAPTCAGSQDGALSAAAGGGTGPYQYLWNTGQTGSSIQNLGCGIYTVTATDAQNCSQVASDTLPCAPPLVIDSVRTIPVRCFSEANGQITVFAQGGIGLLSFSWSDPNQQTNAMAVNLPPGTYTVTVTDANNCSQTASATVTQPPPLTASIVSSDVDCFGGNNGRATATASGGVPPYLYTWSTGQTTPIITSLSAGTYSLTVVDANGCPFSIVSTDILQPATPLLVNVSQVRQSCFGATDGEALAAASGSNGPPYTFGWSNGATGPNPSNFTKGTYTVTATDANGCTGTQTVTITEWDSIQVNVALVLPSCQGLSDGQAAVNLVSGGAGNGDVANYSFQWSVPGAADTIYLNGLAGGQAYGLTVTDNEGCSAAFSFFMAAPPAIVLTLQADSVSCFGLSDGAVQVAGVQAPRPIAQYVWSNSASGQQITDVPAGMYTVVGTDTKGCTGSASATVYEPPLLALQLDIQPLLCNDDNNGAILANVSGGTAPYRYFWNTGSIDPNLSSLGPGNYALTVVDDRGCTASDSTFLSQPNPPVIDLDMVEPSCFGSSDGLVRVVVSGGTAPYRYSLNGGPVSGSGVFLGLKAGAYSVAVQDGSGCITTVEFALNEPPPVAVDLGPDLLINLGDSILLTASVFNAAGMVQYDWQGALVDSIRCVDPADCSSVWAFPVYTNTYRLTVTDENGCRGETSISIEVLKPRGVYVPTGFSPNGDGNNELLVIYGKSQQIKRVKIFRVFDRWGELVYEDADFAVNDEQRGWNGIFRGQDAQAGIYVWYAEVEYLDGFEQVIRGNTALIR